MKCGVALAGPKGGRPLPQYASANLAEARACRELLSGDEGLVASNKEDYVWPARPCIQQERDHRRYLASGQDSGGPGAAHSCPRLV